MTELSRRLDRLSPRQKRELLAKLSQRGPRPPRFPLSFAQERLWFLDRLVPDSPFYNQSLSLRLSRRLHPETLERAIQQIVARHGSLRTTFHAEHGSPEQRIAPGVEVPLKRIDLSGKPEAERERLALEAAERESRKPFDLSAGPLIRTTLVKLSEEDHLLLLTLHHIVSDGWSLGVFFGELEAIYEALLQDRPVDLPPLPLQYVDYAVWQRKWMAGETLRKELDWWRDRLRGCSFLDLPTDRPRPANPSYRGSFLQLEISAQLTAALRALGREQGATLFMVLLAAFQTLLARWSGQSDILVGVPVANRTRAELEGLIGFFVNTLVVRTDLSGDPTFRVALRRVRETAVAAFAHQELPFEKLVEAVRPERDPSRNPLFQVTFQLLSVSGAAGASGRLGEGGAKSFLVQRGTSNVDLAFDLFEVGDRLQGIFEFSSDLFEESSVRRLADQFKLLLESAVSDPDQTLSRLRVLTAADRRLLDDGNATDIEFPRHLTLDQLFDRQAASAPQAPALRFGEAELKFGELQVQADGFATSLAGLGVRLGDRVALCLERSLEMVPALLGVLKAGAAHVAVEPSLPQDRIDFILRDSGARAIITQRRLAPLFKDTRRETPLLFADEPAAKAPAEPGRAIGPGPIDLAAIVYTSGSTGRPKGVALSHRALVNQVCWAKQAFPLAPGESTLQKYSLSFDAALLEIFLPLVCEGVLVLARPDGHLDPGYLVDLTRRRQIRGLDVVPSLLEALLREESLADCDRLRWILCGGEELSADLARRCLEVTGAELFNVYGPAEAAVTATWSRCQPSDEGRAPIGRPIDNMKAHVLDAWLNPVPIGTTGEIFLSGEGLAMGYWRRPAQTAERFLPNPFASRPGDRLYRTGDLARRRGDGLLEFVGRTDAQIKLRGFRIEPGEIEARLKSHPAIHDAAALMQATSAGEDPAERKLVAYYTAERPIPAAELRRRLAETLPDFMLPALYAHVPELPRSSSGKLDRFALEALGREAEAAVSEAFVPPRDEVEERVAGIWSGLLDMDRVGVEENFFDLGGHSLLLIRLQHELKQAFSRLVPVVDLFRHPTVASLAARLREPEQTKEQLPQVDTQLRARAEKQRAALGRRRGLNRGGHSE